MQMLWVFFHPHLRIKSKTSANALYGKALDYRFYTRVHMEKKKHLPIEGL